MGISVIVPVSVTIDDISVIVPLDADVMSVMVSLDIEDPIMFEVSWLVEALEVESGIDVVVIISLVIEVSEPVPETAVVGSVPLTEVSVECDIEVASLASDEIALSMLDICAKAPPAKAKIAKCLTAMIST